MVWMETQQKELAFYQCNLHSVQENQKATMRQMHLLRFRPKEEELAIPTMVKIIEVPQPLKLSSKEKD